MTNPLFARQATITSLYNSIAGMPEQDLLAFWQLCPLGCDAITEAHDPTCNVSWLESVSLLSNQGARPTRGLWASLLAKNEEKVAQYLGYYSGPKLITNEVHRVVNWTRFIRTKFSKVVRAGTRKMTLISSAQADPLYQTRTIKKSGFSPFNDLVEFIFGDSILSPLELEKVCNFWVYPDGYELEDGWALRPSSIEDWLMGQLTLCFPLWTAIKPELYYVWPDEHGRVKDLGICNDSNYVEKVSLYQESWDLPHGYVRLAKEACPTCGGTDSDDCDACNLPSIPICLIPRDWQAGIFSFVPIENTGTEEVPCWQVADSIESCCQNLVQGLSPISARFMYQCYCTQPLDVEINYVSSCSGSWFDDCLSNESCDELLTALANLTLADMPDACNCGCLDNKKSYLQQDMVRFIDRSRVQNITADMLKFGTRRGDIETYILLKNFVDRRKRKSSYI